MSSLWFVVPAHGRVDLARICLAQLRNTCDQLAVSGIDASAVVIADDENLDTAACLGFWGYEQENSFLGRKFNDGYELAAREGVDYVVPLGSDDWVHPDLVAGADLPQGRIRCARRLVMVSEDGQEFVRLSVAYEGGMGIRVTPTELLAPLGYRPCGEDRKRAIDTHTLRALTTAHRDKPQLLEYFDAHEWQLVDFKTPSANLNTWAMCTTSHPNAQTSLLHEGIEKDPWPSLEEHYPVTSVIEMQAFYEAS
ncbi:MAG TPA: glycosyltransferase family A protein, partial [Gemmatimonadales bacterium]|nr:glycosyltransferase family A protein [Gemmatimonadales bacterium]